MCGRTNCRRRETTACATSRFQSTSSKRLPMEPMTLAIALGAIIGAMLALTGAGGGVLAIPLLVFGLHLPVQQAAPVGLVAVGLAAAFGAALGLRQRIVRYRAAGLIGLT